MSADDDADELQLKIGISLGLFFVSLSGTLMPHDFRAFAHVLFPDHSCIVPIYYKTRKSTACTVSCLLPRQALWHRGHSLHRLCTLAPRCVWQVPVQMDRIRRVRPFWRSNLLLPTYRAYRRLGSLLSIFFVECA